MARHEVFVLQIGSEWPRAVPSLSLSPGQMVIGAGRVVRIHPLREGRKYAPKLVHPPFEMTVSTSSDADVVGIHSLGSDIIVAQFDGTVRKFARGRCTAHYAHARGLTSLSGHGERFLTVSGGSASSGIGAWRSTSSSSSTPSPSPPTPASASLWHANSPWIPPGSISLPSRAWSASLNEHGAFFGLRGGIHWHDASLSPRAILRPIQGNNDAASRSAAYGMAVTPNTLLSAWHDGVVRLHDLRTEKQVMALHDPWADSALYSACFVGAHGVAAGGAEHGIVNIWDIRTRDGWSIFSPHGRGSPVYDIKGDGSRVWGVTDRRAFVLAFDDEGASVNGISRIPRESRSTKDVPKGWKPRGGKAWTVHYGEHAQRESVMGYRHGDGGMRLFESRAPS